jgi:UDP-glucuronate decarboxylase
MKRILVTGGAGFLGSHLCERLVYGHGDHVTCLDDLSTGHRDNIKRLLGHPRFEFVAGDVADPIFIKADEIYNLACPASPIQYQVDPVRTVRTCVMGAINVLDMARREGCPILHASTSEVYGDPDVHPQPESYAGNVNPIGPRACYDEGKRCAETLMFDYRRQYGVQIRVARIFNTYGPRMRQDDGRVVSNFITQALRGDDITIIGAGTQTRSFCYVDDTITGLIAMMASGRCGPVNLGNPAEMTIVALAELIRSMTRSGSDIVSVDATADDPRRRRPDITLASAQLGWQPKVSLIEGLGKTIAYFEGELAELAAA